MSFDQMTWLNPPPQSTVAGTSLTMTTAAQTDFWRRTHYGYSRHTGHFLHHPVAGDFTAEVTIAARYQTQYDQAGLMLRIDDTRWVKAGVEYTDGQCIFSTVITNDRSDWSIFALPFPADQLRLRLTRQGDALWVQLCQPDGTWPTTRLGYLEAGSAQLGPMACSPGETGFTVQFHDYSFGPATPGMS